MMMVMMIVLLILMLLLLVLVSVSVLMVMFLSYVIVSVFVIIALLDFMNELMHLQFVTFQFINNSLVFSASLLLEVLIGQFILFV